MAGVGTAAAFAGRFFMKERGFFSRAKEIQGVVASSKLPPPDKRVDAEATLEVLYSVDERAIHRRTACALPRSTPRGSGVARSVTLLVDPNQPDRPREAQFARAQSGAINLLPWGLGVGALGAVFLFLRELRRTIRAELEPLRRGDLVWLTPDGPLPETRSEIVFPASYYRKDVKRRRPRPRSPRPRARPQWREGARRGDSPRAGIGSASSTRIWPAPSAGCVEPRGQGGPKICG